MKIKAFFGAVFIVLVFSLCLAAVGYAENEMGRNTGVLGEVTLRGRIVEINDAYRFAVINLGTADGIKKGMIFNIFQRDDEVAKIKVTKARRHISACDIQLVYSGRGIGVGDLAIYKEPVPIVKFLKPLQSTRMIEVDSIVVDIDAPKRVILNNSLRVFKEFGTVITFSDPKEYTLRAQRRLDMPLLADLMTEWGSYTRDRIFYTAEVTTTPAYNRLTIHLRGVYDKEGQFYNHEIKKTSPTYKEAQEMAFTIKDLSEKL